MALKQSSMFTYKTIKGPLHKVPALVKFLLLLPLSIFFMSLEAMYLAAGIVVFCVIAFLCRFSWREQITDLKPALFYALLMYALSIFSTLIDSGREISSLSFLSVIKPNADFARISLRLVIIVQLSALLFRTTSLSELRDALFTIEFAIRRFFAKLFFQKKVISIHNSFSEQIALFLHFIPALFENWTLINLAWKARGGKNGFVKIKSLVFLFISLSMEKAALKAKALEARQ
jgi:energy-coupling factor transporter transmembrane protein EcfT